MEKESIFLSASVVHQWHCDHYGHLNTRHYAALFDDAIFLFWGRFGVQLPEEGASSVVPVTAEMKTGFLSETRAGTIVSICVHVVRVGAKSVTLHFEMSEARSDKLLATCDAVEVFFDTQSRTSQAIPAALRDRLQTEVEIVPA
ncbi:acyl-CoA thioesterase [Pseudomonas sp. MOB-449]|nr:acyl-CoA thioesterase [Pseudomonas sp. MOB-449]